MPLKNQHWTLIKAILKGCSTTKMNIKSNSSYKLRTATLSQTLITPAL